MKSIILLLMIVLASSEGCALSNTRHVYRQRGKENFFTAYEHCRSIGKQLLTLPTREESIQFGQHLQENNIYSVWLAATDLGHEGEFVWLTSGARVIEANYAEFGSPNNAEGREHCMEIVGKLNNNYGQWNDFRCDLTKEFYCEDVPDENGRSRAGGNFVLHG